MKYVVSLAAVALAAVALYATAAPAGQQAVSPAQFNALKARVTKLEKRASTLEAAIGLCFQGAIPAARYTGYVAANNAGQAIITTAIDVADKGGSPQAYVLDVGSDCANAINSSAGFGHHFQIRRLQAHAR
jgi:hypothetical protein